MRTAAHRLPGDAVGGRTPHLSRQQHGARRSQRRQLPQWNQALSRAGGRFFLSADDPIPSNNGVILTVAQIVKAVMFSTAGAELGALYINARLGLAIVVHYPSTRIHHGLRGKGIGVSTNLW